MARTKPFDKLAVRYDEWFDRHSHAYESELLAVRSLLPHTGEGIEIGVGTGRFAVPLGIMRGLEPSAAMARIAASRGVAVIPGVAEHLPIADSELDFVLLVTTICFLDDAGVALAEIYRVLRPGGAAIVGFIDKNSRLGRRYQARAAANPFYRRARFFSAGEVAALLTNAGFSDLAFGQTLFRDPGDMTDVDPVREGYGEGAFVVVRGIKPGVAKPPE